MGVSLSGYSYVFGAYLHVAKCVGAQNSYHCNSCTKVLDTAASYQVESVVSKYMFNKNVRNQNALEWVSSVARSAFR